MTKVLANGRIAAPLALKSVQHVAHNFDSDIGPWATIFTSQASQLSHLSPPTKEETPQVRE
jgi:hypothetical protein